MKTHLLHAALLRKMGNRCVGTSAKRQKTNARYNRYEPQHDKPTMWLCAQRRFRSAWTSAQSDQSLHCTLYGYLRTQAFFLRTAKTLIRLGGCPGWSEFSVGAHAILLVLSWGGSYSDHCHKEQLKITEIFERLLMSGKSATTRAWCQNRCKGNGQEQIQSYQAPYGKGPQTIKTALFKTT